MAADEQGRLGHDESGRQFDAAKRAGRLYGRFHAYRQHWPHGRSDGESDQTLAEHHLL